MIASPATLLLTPADSARAIASVYTVSLLATLPLVVAAAAAVALRRSSAEVRALVWRSAVVTLLVMFIGRQLPLHWIAWVVPSLLAAPLGVGRMALLASLGAAIAGGLLFFVFKAREFRTFDNILGGLVVGLVVVGGWYLTGDIGHLAEDPSTLEEKFFATNSGRMESLSFVGPQAYTLELLLLWSDKSRVATFGIAAVLGMFAGSLAWSLATRSFRLESFRDAGDLVQHLAGGALMGFGGVLALGCTIGQGVSGVSTLALGSFLALFATIAGAAVTMKIQYWRLMKEV